MKKKIRVPLLALFILGLVYILIPGPSSVEDFAPLPNSTRSDLDGDTWQNVNIAAYFSDFRRDYITKFYRNNLLSKHIFGGIIPPVSLNHPPEAAYQYIRDQQESYFLEEYLYPLRESLFVNGYDPLGVNTMYNRAEQVGDVGNRYWFKEKPYNTKTTLRYYPSSPFARGLVYLGIWASMLALYKIFIKEMRRN